MAYDPLRRLQTPDFFPEGMPEWQNMGESQGVNIAPAVGAFKQRFMGSMGDQKNVPTPTMNDLPEMDAIMPQGAGGDVMKGKMKSL